MSTMTLNQRNYVARNEFESYQVKTDGKFEDLTNIMLREFDKVYERFDSVDQRFDGIDERLNGIDMHLADHDKRFDAADKRFDEMGERFDGLSGDIKLIMNHLGIKRPIIRA